MLLFVAAHALPVPHDDTASIADTFTSIARRLRDYSWRPGKGFK